MGNDLFKKYKPLEPDYNVQCAVENLKTAYWSNETENVAKHFTEADGMIVSAICHYGYSVCKQPQGEWVAITSCLDNDIHIICSHCKEEFIGKSTLEEWKKEYLFCHRCGAKMRID